MASAAAKAFGKGSDTYTDPEADMEPDAAESESELPPDFESAYAAYEADPSAQTFWDAVEACTAGGTSIGIALPIGKGKK